MNYQIYFIPILVLLMHCLYGNEIFIYLIISLISTDILLAFRQSRKSECTIHGRYLLLSFRKQDGQIWVVLIVFILLSQQEKSLGMHPDRTEWCEVRELVDYVHIIYIFIRNSDRLYLVFREYYRLWIGSTVFPIHIFLSAVNVNNVKWN